MHDTSFLVSSSTLMEGTRTENQAVFFVVVGIKRPLVADSKFLFSWSFFSLSRS